MQLSAVVRLRNEESSSTQHHCLLLPLAAAAIQRSSGKATYNFFQIVVLLMGFKSSHKRKFACDVVCYSV
jgi:hypothetical protein